MGVGGMNEAMESLAIIMHLRFPLTLHGSKLTLCAIRYACLP